MHYHLCSHPLFGLPKRLANVEEYQWVLVFRVNKFNDTTLFRENLRIWRYTINLLYVTRQVDYVV